MLVAKPERKRPFAGKAMDQTIIITLLVPGCTGRLC
jgi:hypothetical protein